MKKYVVFWERYINNCAVSGTWFLQEPLKANNPEEVMEVLGRPKNIGPLDLKETRVSIVEVSGPEAVTVIDKSNRRNDLGN